MEKNIYDDLKNWQDTHWWCVGKRNILLDTIKHHCLQKKSAQQLKILDAGCGMGVLLEALSSYGLAFGMDCEEEAVRFCNTKWKEYVKYGELPDDVPFESNDFDIIIASDVIEHIEKDSDSLNALYKLLKNNGKLLITVPAFKFLWGYNDELVKHKRRYCKTELIDLVEESGFKIEKCSYYNFWLFPFCFIVRIFKRMFNIRTQDMVNPQKISKLNQLLLYIFESEKYWLRKHSFPWGVSLLMVCVK